MSVKNIQSTGIPDKNIRGTGSNNPVAGNTASQTSGAGNASPSGQDSLQITSEKFVHDHDFSQYVLTKLDEKGIESLAQIKKNIDAGAYDSENIQEEISVMIGNNLAGHGPALFMGDTKEGSLGSISIPSEKMEFLTKNDGVTNAIATKLVEDLSKL
ncbi:MAG: hypothetical protein WEB89_03715 [Balneolales bacterium]